MGEGNQQGVIDEETLRLARLCLDPTVSKYPGARDSLIEMFAKAIILVGGGMTQQRDREWIMAMAAALGMDSNMPIPAEPTAEAFKLLFDAVAGRAGAKTFTLPDSVEELDLPGILRGAVPGIAA
jgi:hypothetical protein